MPAKATPKTTKAASKITRAGKQEPFFTPKAIHDIQFSSVSFFVLCELLFHYAYIMRQLVLNPNLETHKVVLHGSLFVVNLVGSIFWLLAKFYPYIYRVEIAEERAAEKAAEKKSN